jgi:surfeit locus 1 family protein
MRRSIWPVLLFAAIGVAVLVSLGVWQLQRLAWKELLIAGIDASLAADPLSWSDAMSHPNPFSLKVRVTGEFQDEDYVLFLSTHGGGPAWTVLRPFKTHEGVTIAVALGKSLSDKPPPKPQGTITVEGITVGHTGQKGPFDPDNPTSGNVWYWYDLATLSERLRIRNPHFSLQLLPGSPGTEGLQVDPPKATLRNNHLGYAITWFGLAIVLVVMTVLFLRSRTNEG